MRTWRFSNAQVASQPSPDTSLSSTMPLPQTACGIGSSMASPAPGLARFHLIRRHFCISARTGYFCEIAICRTAKGRQRENQLFERSIHTNIFILAAPRQPWRIGPYLHRKYVEVYLIGAFQNKIKIIEYQSIPEYFRTNVFQFELQTAPFPDLYVVISDSEYQPDTFDCSSPHGERME